jgi:hypothetical protein
MSSYEEMLMAALLNPPDPNEPQPPANRKATIFGVVISFMVRWLQDVHITVLTPNTGTCLDSCHISPLGAPQGRERTWVRRCICASISCVYYILGMVRLGN